MGEFSSKDFNLHKVDNLYNVGDMVYGNLSEAKTARYVKIVQLSGALTNDISFTGAEIYLFEDTTPQDNNAPGDTNERMIKASDLTIKQVNEEVYKTGKRIQYVFEEYEKYNSVWTIKYNVFVEDNAPYLRSNLEISSSNKDVAFDYIDVDRFALPKTVEGLFHHPPLKDISSMWIGKYELVLGQPIYANGMYFGSISCIRHRCSK